MDRTCQIAYEKDFTIDFLRSRGDGFQLLFEKLISKRFPADFMACRPWGNVGDRKNDGYLPSKRTLFQVYAPNDMSASEAIAKIHEDFAGALQHWEKYFDTWVFVHNTHDGRLPPHVIEELLKLNQANPRITITHWGLEELMIEFRQLDLVALESWYGPAMTSVDKVNLGFEDLKAVLTHITTAQGLTASEPKEVPFGKIEYNLLSPAVVSFLKVGMEKAPLVKAFFDGWKNPTYGVQVVGAFKKRYSDLRDQTPTLHPDEIFGHLEEWAGGNADVTPKHKVAVLAVLAYLFDSCDIFEEPPGIIQ
jgi:hypothetical protein